MSILKIVVTEQHLELLKHLKCNLFNDNLMLTIEADEDIPVLVTDRTKYEYIDLILNGNVYDIDPLTNEEPIEYSEEQKAEWDKLYNELPLVLSILLQYGKIELGEYKAKFHDQVWKKLNKTV